MARPTVKTRVNLSDRLTNQKVRNWVAAAEGVYEVAFVPAGERRSLKANARYWAGTVTTFQQFMRNHGQYFDKEEVHEFFLQMFASRDVVDPKTGEVLTVIGQRSSKMSKERFTQFVNDVEGWMLDKFNLDVQEPEYAGTEGAKATSDAGKSRGGGMT